MTQEALQQYLTRVFLISMAVGLAAVLFVAGHDEALGSTIARISLVICAPTGFALFIVALRRYFAAKKDAE